MGRNTNLEKFRKVLFEDFDEITGLSPTELNQLTRIRSIFSISLENPSTPDLYLRDYLKSEFDISDTQAYRDIGNMRVLLPNVQHAAKAWHQYLVNEELKQVIGICKLHGAKYLKEWIYATDKYAKYNKLHKDDAMQLPWEEIKPQSIEPTNDVTILGVKPLENKEEEIKKMYEKYKGDIEIDDIEFEEVKTPDDERD